MNMVAFVPSEKALLEKIVEAQVAAGYKAWKFIIEEGDYEHKGDGEFHSSSVDYPCAEDGFHVLGVLLDTKGCKKVYTGYWCEDCDSRCAGMDCPFHKPYHLFIMSAILDSWNSGKGNNTYAALMKAVSLLPK